MVGVEVDCDYFVWIVELGGCYGGEVDWFGVDDGDDVFSFYFVVLYFDFVVGWQDVVDEYCGFG